MRLSILILFLFSLLSACSSGAPNARASVTATATSGPTLGTTIAPSDTVQPDSGQRLSAVTTDLLNIRAGPGTNYTIVGQLQEGETITIIGKSPDGLWWRIDRGWVSATYVKVSGDASAVPVTTALPQPTP